MLPETLTVPAHAIAERLIARKESIAVAESSAGGLISAALLSVPGASAYYRGGLVVYSLEGVRAQLAGAPPVPDGTRSASQPFVEYLARTVAEQLNTDWGLAETGATGPSGNPYGDPAGHAWVGAAGPDGILTSEHVLTGSADRPANMEAFAARALAVLAQALA
ncbi:MAG: CinA family protein [Solirubrobacterales bacterium]|nr:CinA family protein [Solirubrobacterales bacterium]